MHHHISQRHHKGWLEAVYKRDGRYEGLVWQTIIARDGPVKVSHDKKRKFLRFQIAEARAIDPPHLIDLGFADQGLWE